MLGLFRRRPDRVDLGELVEIPAGPFTMGTRQEEIPALVERFGGNGDWYRNETPQHQVTLLHYRISRAPVTVAQYRAFVRASRYKWDGAGRQQGGEDHPVVYVSWHDALAYCEWLSGVWRASGQIEANEMVQLPSEAEWEKAARGTDGRIYPWGNEPPDAQRCNFDLDVRTTTSAGLHSPHGDSPYGCVDMAGNVWEWTRSLWGKGLDPEFGYPHDSRDGREDLTAANDVHRVLRGGAFYNEARFVRAAYRNWRYPLSRYNRIGFRIVVVPPVSL